MRNNDYLLNSASAKELYLKVKELPIYDYHCHLVPKEIWEDEVFTDIGALWLGGDHYKWRLMRLAGIDEELITGKASNHDKFIAYAKALEGAVGNPLYVWSHMELEMFFGISETLNSESAERIWDEANKIIKENKLSPRKLINSSNVKFIGTTDDPCDTLEYHEKIAADTTFDVLVTPTFRTDKLLLITAPDYAEYISKLSAASGINVCDFESYLDAVKARLDYFCAKGCRFSDLGLPYFPSAIANPRDAKKIFEAVLGGKKASGEDFNAFLGFMYIYLSMLYKERNITVQLHLAVRRNVNAALHKSIGVDCGGDCIGSAVDGDSLIMLLSAMEENGGIPNTILYTLNPANYDEIVSIIGSFRNVRLGAAWWFNDHKEGIVQVMKAVSALGHLGYFTGMLTDSRSFLSYARHDYFRRILCSYLADIEASGEYLDDLLPVAENICYKNIAKSV